MLTDKAKEIVNQTESKMQDAVNFLEEDLKSYRVGKANPLIFNNVSVDYYGTPTPVSQVASITTPDAKTLAIQPWEKNMIPKIEKAIIDANLGFTPQNKKAKASGENAKIVVRNARRDGIDLLKKAQKNDGLSEDEQKEAEGEIQKVTDKNVKAVDELVAAKEKDIMTV